jgi:hypothetical protein
MFALINLSFAINTSAINIRWDEVREIKLRKSPEISWSISQASLLHESK